MAKIPLEDLDKYTDESSFEKFKKKDSNPKKKHVKKNKHHINKDVE